MDGNRFCSINSLQDSCFFSLTELKMLEMRATRMRLLPVTLPKLTKLERLDLGANSFIEFVS